MINSNQILSKLSPFKNYRKIVIQDQSVNDIINGILDTHEKYKNEYDKISQDFIGSSELETARNIWNFLHSNVPYYVESTKNQTLRSPSAIVAMPGDCKSYALFANGVFDSLNRKGIYKTPLAYRFADYRNIDEFQHVFAVLYPGTNNEIWIDPVLPRFNQKKQPTSYKDKKIKMALIAMSGVNSTSKEDRQTELKNFLNRLVNERDKLLNDGVITPGSSKELEYKVAINKVTKAMQQAGKSINGFNDISNQVTSFSSINGGLFKFGESKLRDQMQIFIQKYPTAFLYLFLPVGNTGDYNNWGTEYGWNLSTPVPNIPGIVQMKRKKALDTFWNWGQPTGLKAETDIIQMIRQEITKKLGISPEAYWSKKLNVNITEKAPNIIGSFWDNLTTNIDPSQVANNPSSLSSLDFATGAGAVADAFIPGSSEVIKAIGPIIDTLVPDLTWTYPAMEFTPVAEDWKGTIYESKFPINQPATLAPGTTNASMNMYLTLGLVGAGIFLLTRKKK